MSIPKNVIAQQQEDADYTLTEEEIKTKITDFKTKHPKFAAIVEGISNLDLKETVKGYLGAEVLQKLFKYQAKNLVEQQVAPTQSINKCKTSKPFIFLFQKLPGHKRKLFIIVL